MIPIPLTHPFPWKLVGVLVLLAGVFAAGFVRGQKWVQSDWDAEKAEAAAQARNTERQWQHRFDEVRDAKDEDLRRIAAERDRLLGELRKRPERLPEPARATCQGATGAELSGRDAEFLAGLAARADALRAELAACYQREDALRVSR